ncbi:MAG: helix-hairpin-helix domain-containing protein [Luteolibacter sp.]
MTREDLAEALDQIALLMELKGENPFKIRAYRNGSDIVREFEDDIVKLAKDGKLQGIKGIGEALQDKLQILASTGKLPFLEDLRAEFPEGLFDLFDLQGLGPKKIKALYEELKITSIPELQAACDQNKVAGLKGFGTKTQEKILSSITLKQNHADRFLLGDVISVAEKILGLLRMHPEVSRVAIAGSYRRAKETVHDLDFLVETKEGKLVCEDFTAIPDVEEIIACGETKASVRLKTGLQCDLRAVYKEQFAFALMYFTGSKEHNVALRSRALKQGLSLNESGCSPAKEAKSVDIPKNL